MQENALKTGGSAVFSSDFPAEIARIQKEKGCSVEDALEFHCEGLSLNHKAYEALGVPFPKKA
jgi:hypothetical protein